MFALRTGLGLSYSDRQNAGYDGYDYQSDSTAYLYQSQRDEEESKDLPDMRALLSDTVLDDVKKSL